MPATHQTLLYTKLFDRKVLSPIRETSGQVKRVKCQVNCGIGVATGDGRKQCNDGSPHPHCQPICALYTSVV